MCAHSLYGELFRGGKVDRQSGRFSPRGWQEKSVQMERLGRNIQLMDFLLERNLTGEYAWFKEHASLKEDQPGLMHYAL
jgi:hypothetical protein